MTGTSLSVAGDPDALALFTLVSYGGGVRADPGASGSCYAPRGADRDAQASPRIASDRFGEVHDLANVIRNVCERPGKGVVHFERLSADHHRMPEMVVGRSIQCVEQCVPAGIPFLEHLVSSHGTLHELLVALPPGLLAVAREEIREARSEIAADVPRAPRLNFRRSVRHCELAVVELGQGRVAKRFVTAEFCSDRREDGRGHKSELNHEAFKLSSCSSWLRSYGRRPSSRPSRPRSFSSHLDRGAPRRGTMPRTATGAGRRRA